MAGKASNKARLTMERFGRYLKDPDGPLAEHVAEWRLKEPVIGTDPRAFAQWRMEGWMDYRNLLLARSAIGGWGGGNLPEDQAQRAAYKALARIAYGRCAGRAQAWGRWIGQAIKFDRPPKAEGQEVIAALPAGELARQFPVGRDVDLFISDELFAWSNHWALMLAHIVVHEREPEWYPALLRVTEDYNVTMKLVNDVRDILAEETNKTEGHIIGRRAEKMHRKGYIETDDDILWSEVDKVEALRPVKKGQEEDVDWV